MKVRSPICIVGGKYHISSWIVSHFPPHRIYVDMFGGGAHVLCAKTPSSLEIFNDIDQNIINFFEAIRTRPSEFLKGFKYLMYSETIYNRWKKVSPPEDMMDRAVWWFYQLRASFSGKFGSGFGHNHGSTGGGKAYAYRSALRLIPALAARFANIEIHNHDFRDELIQCDGPETLFYLDPPYWLQNSGNSKCYTHDFTEQDHQDLAVLLKNVKGKVVLNYYPHPVLDEIYKQWNCYEKETVAYSKGITRNSKSRTRPKRIVRMYCNFEWAGANVGANHDSPLRGYDEIENTRTIGEGDVAGTAQRSAGEGDRS